MLKMLWLDIFAKYPFLYFTSGDTKSVPYSFQVSIFVFHPLAKYVDTQNISLGIHSQ